MAVSVTILAAPTSPTATKAVGGSLAATTYYYRIVGVYRRSTTMTYVNQIGIPSAEVRDTTDAVRAQIDLTWNAVAGANDYLIYRSKVSGDYDPATAHCLGLVGNVTAYSDTGAAALAKYVYYPYGLPKIAITGGTEGAPNTDADVYTAYVTAGMDANLYSRSADVYGAVYDYHFVGYLNIDGAFRILKGVTLHLDGLWDSTANAIFLMGTLASGATKEGAALIRTGWYAGTLHYGIYKWYASRVQDRGYIDYDGQAYKRYAQAPTSYATWDVRDSIVDGFNFADIGGAGLIDNSYLYLPGGIHTAMLAVSNIKISGAYVIYCYYAGASTYGNPWCRGVKQGGGNADIRFHIQAITTKYHAINHQWFTDPPTAAAASNPTYLTVYRCYDGLIKCVDVLGNPVAGVKVTLTDALGNVLTPEVSDADGYVWMASGTATGGSTTTIVDTSKSWTANVLVDFLAEIYSGTGIGSFQSIKSNNGTTITWKGAVPTAPVAGSKYRVKVILSSHAYQGKAAIPYYDTTAINPWTLRAVKAGYEMTVMELSPTAEFSYVVPMSLAYGSGGIAR